jgi:hypothetical protein
MMSRIDSWHRKISTGRHFQNGHHNTAQIQHCPISTTFHMWVDYDVSNWFLTSKGASLSTHISNFDDIGQCWIFAVLWWPFWKWWPVEIVRCQESIWDIIIYPHMKCRWNRTMLNLCGIVVAILKMATDRYFSMSGINSGHHNLPTYEMALKSVPNWFLASNNFYRSPFSKWPPQYCKNSTLSDIIKIWYVGR